MKLIKVKGYGDYSKDVSTGNVINTNTQEYNNARIRAGKARMQEKRIKSLESELTNIKQTLKRLMSNGN